MAVCHTVCAAPVRCAVLSPWPHAPAPGPTPHAPGPTPQAPRPRPVPCAATKRINAYRSCGWGSRSPPVGEQEQREAPPSSVSVCSSWLRRVQRKAGVRERPRGPQGFRAAGDAETKENRMPGLCRPHVHLSYEKEEKVGHLGPRSCALSSLGTRMCGVSRLSCLSR